jgi:hypothetical protein
MDISEDESQLASGDRAALHTLEQAARRRSAGPMPRRPRWMAWLSWVGGVAWLAAGIPMATQPHLHFAGLGFAVAGLLILPPIVSGLRKHLPFLRPTLAPPLVSMVAFFGFGIPLHAALDAPAPPTVAPAPATQAAVAPPPAKAADTPSDPAQDAESYIAELQKMILPVVEEPSGKGPYPEPEMRGRMGDIEFWNRHLAKGRAMTMTPEQRAVVDRFEASLKAKQITEFPKLRAAYRAQAKKKLWVNDVDVSGSGRNIEFVGAMFAAHKNIADAMATLNADLNQYRFGRATYMWMRDGEFSYYDLKTPKDGDLVVPQS